MKEQFAKYLMPTIISICTVFAPIKGALLVTGFLIFADLFTGIMAARKRGEKVSSAGLRRTVTKMVVYNVAIISGFLVQTYMINDFLPFTSLISGVISVVELKSILENLNTINGTDIYKIIVDKLGSINDKTKDQ